MCKLKEAKHGGRCEQDQESVGNIFIKTDQDKQFIEQSQDCALVDVHCYSKEKNPQYQDQFKVRRKEGKEGMMCNIPVA